MVAVSFPPPHARKRVVQTSFEDLNTHMPNATREAREILGLPPLSRSSSASTLTGGSEDNGPETPERLSNPLPALGSSSQGEAKEAETPIAPPIFEAPPAEPIPKRASFTSSPSSPATPDTRSSRIYTAPIVVGRGQSTDNLLGPPPKRKPVGRWNKAKKAVTKVFTDPLGVHEWAHTVQHDVGGDEGDATSWEESSYLVLDHFRDLSHSIFLASFGHFLVKEIVIRNWAHAITQVSLFNAGIVIFKIVFGIIVFLSSP